LRLCGNTTQKASKQHAYKHDNSSVHVFLSRRFAANRSLLTVIV